MATQQFNTNVDVNGEVKGTSLDINGTGDISGNLELQADLDVSGTITGDGSGIDSINASNISSGTLAAARVATLNQNTTGTAATVTGSTQASITSCANLTTVGTIATGVWRGTRISTAYQYQRQTFDFKGYSTHDGTNYEMAEIMTDTNAPFEHNTSTGANGTNAMTVSVLLRSAGQVMPYAGTIKKWTGWAAGSGSGTTYIALFRYRPVVGSSSAVSPVLIDEQTLTVAGNNTAVAIEQTSFTDGDIAAGDIIISMMKGVSAKTTYFTSTMEIEWD